MVAEAAVDSMKQQMLELCRSDTLSRAREQHDRDLAVMKEQHDVALLTLQQKLDSTSQALNEQVCKVTVTECRHDKYNEGNQQVTCCTLMNSNKCLDGDLQTQ